MSKYSVEDWAIISSSSDLDDESHNDRLLEVDSIHLEFDTETCDPSYPRDSVSSITTFKLPRVDDSNKVDDGSSSNNNIESNIESSKCSVDQSDLEPDFPSSQSLPNDNDIPVSQSPISSKIKFYENLSSLNESIKQKSDDFYQNFAKYKLDQLNNYISRDQIAYNNDVDHSGNDDTVIVSADILAPKTSVSAFQQVFVSHPVRFFLRFLENHSKYLYYYAFVVCAIVASAAVYGMPSFIVNKKESTTLDKIYDVWDKMMYEDSTPSAKIYFWRQGKPKTNRILKYSQLLEVLIIERTGTLKGRVLDYYDSIRDILEDFTISDKLNLYVQTSKQYGEYYVEFSNRFYRNFEAEFLKPFKEESIANLHKVSDFEFLRENFRSLWNKTYSYSDDTLKQFNVILQQGLNKSTGYFEIAKFYAASGVNSLRRNGNTGLNKVNAIRQQEMKEFLSWLNSTMSESKQQIEQVLITIDQVEEPTLNAWKQNYGELVTYINTFKENLDSVSIFTAKKIKDVYNDVYNNLTSFMNSEQLKTNIANGKHHLDTVAIKIYRQSKTIWNSLINN